MDKAKSISESWELPPLRSLTDFLLESSRFQLPNFGDFEKWGNRVVNNLVYYQTNYLYMTIAIMLIVGSMHPLKMVVGMLAMLAIWGQCFFVFSGNTSICEIRRQYPQLPIILTVICACYVAFQRYAVLIFLFSLLLSFCVTFVHASLRLRNLKNKLVNKIGGMGLDRTPMGIFLKYFEDETGIALRTQTTFIQSLQ
ncbi:PRA1 family protein Jwa isoform X2 [Andrena cerasifolii]|uniref:PRA1 family protein Jwa isoform X2 n=1 Tax=Andrena cerasifolii TaxID=2819439 RepID=UPI0040375F0D